MSFHPNHLGFRVHYFRDLANAGTIDLRTIKMTDEIPYDVHTQCPACQKDLVIFCTLVAGGDRKRIRIGACETCGYLGYIDRPTKEWMVRYYEEDWDNARVRDVKKDAAALTHALSREQQDLIHLAVDERILRTRAVCDIGCGSGSILKGMADAGFTNLVGVENSRYRAELAREKYGYNILVGNFENADIQKTLFQQSPIGVFLSFHVMEHVYHPREVVASCATLQKEGDHLIFAMPDLLHEPAIVTLFWLPHLHSYTRMTLERLFNTYGYEVVADNFSHRRLMMAAKKVKNPKPRYTAQFDQHEAAARLIDWFFLRQMDPERRYMVSWTSKKYQTGVRCVSAHRAIDGFFQSGEWVYDFLATRLFHSFRNRRSVVVSSLEKRITDPKDSYLEIQFDGDIELLVR